MPDISFTERRVRDLAPPATGRDTYHDSTSPLQLRVTPAGAKSWSLQRRVNGKPTRVKLGEWPNMTVADARRRAHAEVSRMAEGINPTAERRAKRQKAQAAAYTVGQSVTDYIADAERGIGRKVPLKPKTLAGYRHVNKKLLAPLAALPLNELGGRQLDGIRRRLSNANANAAIRLLRAAANHAAGRDLISASPFAGRRRQVVALPPRKGHIAEADLGRFIVAIEDLQAGPADQAEHPTPPGERVGADALLLMTLYGLRSGEARTLKWDAVDLEAGVFHVLDTKNSNPLALPITAAARPLFDRRRELAGQLSSDHVFPTVGNRTSATGHLAEPRHAIDRIEAATGLSFTPHDLRRTFASLASRHLPYAMVKRVLNHAASAASDITLDYIQVGVDDLREPLEALHVHMVRLRDIERAQAKAKAKGKAKAA